MTVQGEDLDRHKSIFAIAAGTHVKCDAHACGMATDQTLPVSLLENRQPSAIIIYDCLRFY